MQQGPDLFTIVFTFIMAFVVVAQLGLNAWAFYLQRKVERLVDNSEIPESFKDRSEVTFWQTVSSGFLTLLVISGVLRIFTGIGFEPHIGLTLLGIALSVKTIPSYRWIRRYKTGKFNV